MLLIMNRKLNIPPAVWLVVFTLLSGVFFVFLALAVNDAWKVLSTFKNGVPTVAHIYSKGQDFPTKYSVYTSPQNEFVFQNIQGGKSIVLSRSDASIIEVIYNPEYADQNIPNTFVDWVAIIINIIFSIFVICILIVGYKKVKGVRYL